MIEILFSRVKEVLPHIESKLAKYKPRDSPCILDGHQLLIVEPVVFLLNGLKGLCILYSCDDNLKMLLGLFNLFPVLPHISLKLEDKPEKRTNHTGRMMADLTFG